MKSFVAFAVVTFAAVAQAQYVTSPYEVCKTFVSQSDREACVELVEGKTYDQAALNVCGSIGFQSDKMACLVAIGDKRCQDGPLSVCAVTPTISEKFRCLAKYCQE